MTETEIRATLNEYRDAKRGMMEALRTISMLADKSTATGSTAPKEVQVLASLPLAARFEDIVIDKVNLESILAAELDVLEQMRRNAMDLIAYASNRKHRVILAEYFINAKSNAEIARQLHYDISYIKKMKRKGIKSIAESLK